MPVYEYECLDCGRPTEAFQRISDGPLKVCPECGGRLKKLLSNTSFVLKGSGWYLTDYARKPAEKKDAGKKEAKPGTKTDTPA